MVAVVCVTAARFVCQIAGMKIGFRRLLWVCAALVVLAGVAVIWWVRQFHQYTPVEALRDLQAAGRVGAAARPVERFMQLRYGPMSNPVNRQKAFLDFFNIGHIKGLNMLVKATAPGQRQANIDAMGQWVANYRAALTSQDKAALGAYFRSEAGRRTLQDAAAAYMREDVHFRAGTAGVVQELLATVAMVR
jgi:hypothetical protein